MTGNSVDSRYPLLDGINRILHGHKPLQIIWFQQQNTHLIPHSLRRRMTTGHQAVKSPALSRWDTLFKNSNPLKILIEIK